LRYRTYSSTLLTPCQRKFDPVRDVVVRSLQSFMPDGHDNRIRRRGPWAPKVASTRRTLLRMLAALGVVSAVTSCGAPPGGDSQVSASSPLGPLAACDDQPYVAMFNGVTQDGLNNEKPGSTPSSDIYGIRPDGPSNDSRQIRGRTTLAFRRTRGPSLPLHTPRWARLAQARSGRFRS
jgi:hypothetical protein